MGRKPTANLNLPRGMRARKRTRKSGKTVIYYFYDSRDADGSRKEIPLGKDYTDAVLQWSKLENEKAARGQRPNFAAAAARYEREVLPEKSDKTQRDNRYQLNNLLKFFGGSNPAPLDEIQPEHIKEYFRRRRAAPVAANREIALFSHIWTMCSPAHWNYTDRPNPAKGITRNAEKARDAYIEDHLYGILYTFADQEIKDAMDIAYLTGQRPADTLKIHISHINNGILSITQNKTRAKLRFAITGRLKAIIERRMQTAKAYLIPNRSGSRLTVNAMEKRFAKARAAAAAAYPELADELKACQFRDLRAKSGTDIYLKTDSREAARKHLGHAGVGMTNRYIRRDTVLQPLDFCGTDAEIAEHMSKKRYATD